MGAANVLVESPRYSPQTASVRGNRSIVSQNALLFSRTRLTVGTRIGTIGPRFGLPVPIRRVVAPMLEHEQPNGRRQIAVFALLVDVADQLRQMNAALARNIPQRVPEQILQADAGLVTPNDNGPLNHPRFEMSAACPLLGDLLARA
jgi:hypothetical protein